MAPGEWALFRRVKVPMIRGATGVAVLLCVTGGFQGFDLFFVLTNGGPYGTTEIPTTLLVKTVFRNGEVGYGSAMAVLLTAVVVGVGSSTPGSRRAAARRQAPRARQPEVTRRSARRPTAPAATPAGLLVSAGLVAAGRRLLLPDGLDGPVQLQDRPGHLLVAVRAADVHRPVALGRGLGGRPPGSVRAQQRHRHGRRR